MVELESFEGARMFYASFAAGDLDGDGVNELVVAWKREQEVNRTTLVAYRVIAGRAELAYVLARDEPLLDMGYFEKMMAIADLVDFDPKYAESSWLDVGDVDGDGVVDLVLATGRGDRETTGSHG